MCGIFGVVGHKEAAWLTYLGLYALQHRGQESAGIASSDGKQLRCHVGMGRVRQVFNEDYLLALSGSSAIGHVRYSTQGESTLANAQPIVGETRWGKIAIAHNGQLVDYEHDRHRLKIQEGVIFTTGTDTEIILHLLAKSSFEDLDEALIHVLAKIRGAFSLLIQTNSSTYVARDSSGFRPLCMGRYHHAYAFASETVALEILGDTYLREIAPGEVIKVERGKIQSRSLPKVTGQAHCIFEDVYFSRPDSLGYGQKTLLSRRLMGRCLAREHPVPADIVVRVPDSGNEAAVGYAEEAGIPLEASALIRNHFIGRTFIQPKQSMRNLGVRIKHNPVRELLRGKRIVLVDDSIVRGTTSRKIVRLLRRAGAKEVHLRISSPPMIGSCYYGIDTPRPSRLIAHQKKSEVEEIRKYIGADSLRYLSLAGMKAAVLGDISARGMNQALEENVFCDACFTLNYPIRPSFLPPFEI